ncbi:DUF4377 domain-containing protein [Bizionia sp. KMM 8389]
MILHKLGIGLVLTLLFSCKNNENSQIMYVNNQQVDCIGVAPQKCLQIKFSEAENWTFFYSNIKGFNYKPGYYYKLKVLKETLKNVPADANNISYSLIKTIEKSEVPIK